MNDCVLYRKEKIGDNEYYTTREYCDGLEIIDCENCRFYKSSSEWKAVIVKKQTQYISIE